MAAARHPVTAPRRTPYGSGGYGTAPSSYAATPVASSAPSGTYPGSYNSYNSAAPSSYSATPGGTTPSPYSNYGYGTPSSPATPALASNPYAPSSPASSTYPTTGTPYGASTPGATTPAGVTPPCTGNSCPLPGSGASPGYTTPQGGYGVPAAASPSYSNPNYGTSTTQGYGTGTTQGYGTGTTQGYRTGTTQGYGTGTHDARQATARARRKATARARRKATARARRKATARARRRATARAHRRATVPRLPAEARVPCPPRVRAVPIVIRFGRFRPPEAMTVMATVMVRPPPEQRPRRCRPTRLPTLVVRQAPALPAACPRAAILIRPPVVRFIASRPQPHRRRTRVPIRPAARLLRPHPIPVSRPITGLAACGTRANSRRGASSRLIAVVTGQQFQRFGSRSRRLRANLRRPQLIVRNSHGATLPRGKVLGGVCSFLWDALSMVP